MRFMIMVKATPDSEAGTAPDEGLAEAMAAYHAELAKAGVLLDVTVGVFVIGIIVDRIQRAFDSLDTRKLTALRE